MASKAVVAEKAPATRLKAVLLGSVRGDLVLETKRISLADFKVLFAIGDNGMEAGGKVFCLTKGTYIRLTDSPQSGEDGEYRLEQATDQKLWMRRLSTRMPDWSCLRVKRVGPESKQVYEVHEYEETLRAAVRAGDLLLDTGSMRMFRAEAGMYFRSTLDGCDYVVLPSASAASGVNAEPLLEGIPAECLV